MSGADRDNEFDQDYIDLKDDEELEQAEETKQWEKFVHVFCVCVCHCRRALNKKQNKNKKKRDLNENPIEMTEEPLISKSLKLHRRASQPHFEIKINEQRSTNGNEKKDKAKAKEDTNLFKAFFSKHGYDNSARKKKKKYQTDKPNLLTSITEEHEDTELGIIGLGGAESDDEQKVKKDHMSSDDSNYSIGNINRPLSASGEFRKILQHVSGELIYGELVAIVGASGGGKTTLVSILSGRLHSISGLSGDVQVDFLLLYLNLTFFFLE
ncbi:hypothetical protein RFI_18007 [Reticulomyxa filosa]|uniref:ABC transporter domain-containing protein n=1 Tax=Reticulomyxa filosa TaxID=46433 RepID=X6N1M8_RETFI|nr:hypothetical protein RFI_18007 [Reticulomyxa filosa]|eukprot:ETO19222.1 hypothetical protein RFI_18007 [Reticulomyxa filosa]